MKRYLLFVLLVLLYISQPRVAVSETMDELIAECKNTRFWSEYLKAIDIPLVNECYYPHTFPVMDYVYKVVDVKKVLVKVGEALKKICKSMPWPLDDLCDRTVVDVYDWVVVKVWDFVLTITGYIEKDAKFDVDLTESVCLHYRCIRDQESRYGLDGCAHELANDMDQDCYDEYVNDHLFRPNAEACYVQCRAHADGLRYVHYAYRDNSIIKKIYECYGIKKEFAQKTPPSEPDGFFQGMETCLCETLIGKEILYNDGSPVCTYGKEEEEE